MTVRKGQKTPVSVEIPKCYFYISHTYIHVHEEHLKGSQETELLPWNHINDLSARLSVLRLNYGHPHYNCLLGQSASQEGKWMQ